MTGASPVHQMMELAATALIGTDRAGGTTPAAVLSSAVVAATRSRAGLVPVRGAAATAECPPERLAECTAAAAAILSRLIMTGDWPVVAQWAGLAVATGRRVPENLVPAVLDACASQRGLAKAFGDAIGECGRWLAGMNPAWQNLPAGALPEDLETRWTTGTGAERREWLGALRQQDPARAIAVMRSTWADDPAEDRRRFMEGLATGLSLVDEEFLESCLADRSKNVREVAAALLCRLPESRYVGRMTARAESIITIEQPKKGLLKKKGAKVVVDPPAAWEKALEADGLEEKPPGGMGKRAWWLRQVLLCVPPTHWSARGGVEPEELIAALDGNDYEKDVLAAWAQAAPRSGDAAWCAALARRMLDDKKMHDLPIDQMWIGLSPAGAETVLRAVLEAGKGQWFVPWRVLGRTEHDWSPGFSTLAVGVLSQSVPKKTPEWYEVGPAIDAICIRIHPTAAAKLDTALETLFKGDAPQGITRSIDRMRTRADMHREFSS